MLRIAGPADVPAITLLINQAFQVEAFFKVGDRTSHEEVLKLMASGEFLIESEADGISACVYVTCNGDRAYFGMLSVDPSKQRQGLGRRLIEAVEQHARDRGCRFMDIH